VYQIYASEVEGFSKADCIDITFGTAEWDGPTAWEYA